MEVCQYMGKVVRYTNGTTGGPVFVDVKDGKILRITPIEFDENDAPSWTLEARGRKFTPPRKVKIAPWTAAHRSTIYSPRRILTPLKRVDFDPKGKRNIQNRGVSGYEPITWDEALDIVAEEMIRTKREYGPASCMTTTSSHHMWGNVGYRHSAFLRFHGLWGSCQVAHNPDSWEGWHWGAMHMWGNSWRLGDPEGYGMLEDALKNTELLVFWSADADGTNSGVYGGHDSYIRRKWLKELGVKMYVIDPYMNTTAALMGDKWFAPRPGTDVAMALAIAFVWLTEDLYDKEYVATHTHGFDEWKDYVLGKSDGVPKTPEWAEGESLIPARDIRALAREWGSKKTMLGAGGPGGMGGASRCATGNEWARAMVALAAMQGLGKPGINIWSTTTGVPTDTSFLFPGYSEGGISGDANNCAAGYRFGARMFPEGFGAVTNPHQSPEGNMVYRLLIPEAMRHERIEWHGKGFCGPNPESQLQKYHHPANGYGPVGMYYRYGGSFFGTMTQTNRYVTAYREGKVPFVVNQAIWFEGETKFADIVLPACTNFERWDISEFGNCSGYIPDSMTYANHRVIVFQQKCIEPLGQSKSDYDIFAELSKRLDLWGPFTMGGMSDLDWVKRLFHATDMPKVISWDEFAKKGYYVLPSPEEKKSPPALRWFAEDRVKDTHDWGPAPWDHIQNKGLQTQTGKIEFVSNSLKRFEAGGTIDPERPAMGPQYIPSWEGHRTEDLIGKYPLAMISPHPKFSFHTMADHKDAWMCEVKDHRTLVNGHYYWNIRINSEDAAARGIAHGDLVRAFNDRGSVILAAMVTERVPPGTVHSYESCSEYDPLGDPGYSTDRGGCVNLLVSKRFITPTSAAMSNNSCLIQVEKWDGESK